MTQLIDGKKISELELKKLKEEIETLQIKPSLKILIVGNDPGSIVYVNMKKKRGEEVGIVVEIESYERIKLSEILKRINELNNDKATNGFIIQMPIPKELLDINIEVGDEDKYKEAVNMIQNSIDSSKDADGMSTGSAGKLLFGIDTTLPATVKAVLKVLEEIAGDENLKSFISGKNIVIINRSTIVGKPLANALTNLDATVTLAHSKTKNIVDIIKTADIVVSGTGKEKFITGDMIKEGAIVIDVGINKSAMGISGDIDKDSVMGKASWLTPVPGGVGPLTVAMLLRNLIDLTKNESKKI